jgi:HrpA-like RNA helicase
MADVVQAVDVADSGGGASGPTLSDRIRTILIDKVRNNRLTIVIGPTGCGKSTLVPSFLLDQVGGKVLCSQPRRLAVVSVAKRVAQMRSNISSSSGSSSSNNSSTTAALAGSTAAVDWANTDVGYQVGQHNESSTKRTKLLFVTAGILLEELWARGMDLLDSYSCIILDECQQVDD